MQCLALFTFQEQVVAPVNLSSNAHHGERLDAPVGQAPEKRAGTQYSQCLNIGHDGSVFESDRLDKPDSHLTQVKDALTRSGYIACEQQERSCHEREKKNH